MKVSQFKQIIKEAVKEAVKEALTENNTSTINENIEISSKPGLREHYKQVLNLDTNFFNQGKFDLQAFASQTTINQVEEIENDPTTQFINPNYGKIAQMAANKNDKK